MLKRHRGVFERITNCLLEKESICGDEFMELLKMPC